MKKVLITQSNYIPWKGYFDSVKCCDVFVVYDDMQYTKRDWRNRNLIKTVNGLKWLTIPVEVKGKYYQRIKDTVISDKNWTKAHWEILKQNYKTANCFIEMSEWIEPLYKNCGYTYLSDINLHFLRSINEFLKIETQIISSSGFFLHEEKNQRLIDICTALGATDYYSGPAAKSYMDEEKFNKNGIQVHYLDYSGYPEYPQLYVPFEHGVSVLDMIFNLGNKIHLFLK